MAVKVVPFTGSGAIVDRAGVYFGFAVRETGAASASFNIYAGTDNTGVLLDPVRLNANETSGDFYGPQGLEAPIGIYVELVSGTIVGSVRVEAR